MPHRWPLTALLLALVTNSVDAGKRKLRTNAANNLKGKIARTGPDANEIAAAEFIRDYNLDPNPFLDRLRKTSTDRKGPRRLQEDICCFFSAATMFPIEIAGLCASYAEVADSSLRYWNQLTCSHIGNYLCALAELRPATAQLIYTYDILLGRLFAMHAWSHKNPSLFAKAYPRFNELYPTWDTLFALTCSKLSLMENLESLRMQGSPTTMQEWQKFVTVLRQLHKLTSLQVSSDLPNEIRKLLINAGFNEPIRHAEIPFVWTKNIS